jgi:hypothetical protein
LIPYSATCFASGLATGAALAATRETVFANRILCYNLDVFHKIKRSLDKPVNADLISGGRLTCLREHYSIFLASAQSFFRFNPAQN